MAKRGGRKVKPIDPKCLPDLVEEMKNSKPFKYITTDDVHREFELRARSNLLEIRKEVDTMTHGIRGMTSIATKLGFSSDLLNMKLCDILKLAGYPKSTTELMKILQALTVTEKKKKAKFERIYESIEEDTEEGGSSRDVTPPRTKNFPNLKLTRRVAEVDLVTPSSGSAVSVFNFGMNNRAPESSSKEPRQLKPGELLYSQRGSPIIAQAVGRVPAVAPLSQHKPQQRIELTDVDGKKIEVDLVLYSGAPEKAKLFKEFVTDVRGIAATRSTVRAMRVRPPRVPIKSATKGSVTTPASAGKKRDNWH